MIESERVHSGGCLCGAVRYEITGPLRPVIACHCDECRRTSGHYVSATAAPREALRLARTEALTWYRSSSTAQRGFCNVCGSNLFFATDGGSSLSIMAGSLDKPTGLKTVRQIFVEEAGDYYAVPADIVGVEGRGADEDFTEL